MSPRAQGEPGESSQMNGHGSQNRTGDPNRGPPSSAIAKDLPVLGAAVLVEQEEHLGQADSGRLEPGVVDASRQTARIPAHLMSAPRLIRALEHGHATAGHIEDGESDVAVPGQGIVEND